MTIIFCGMYILWVAYWNFPLWIVVNFIAHFKLFTLQNRCFSIVFVSVGNVGCSYMADWVDSAVRCKKSPNKTAVRSKWNDVYNSWNTVIALSNHVTEQVGYILDLLSGDGLLETLPRYQLSWLRVFVVFLRPPRQSYIIVLWLGDDRLLPTPWQFFIHQSPYYSTLYIRNTYSIVK
jgi:hypothetical protein